MRAVLVVLVAVLALVAAFAVQNPGIVTVRFMTLSADTSLLVIIVLSFAAGILAGWLAGVPASFRRARRIRELEAKLAAKGPPGDAPPAPPAAPGG
ncbi:MAG: LapA family protein [Gemmatimonadota bacterium]